MSTTTVEAASAPRRRPRRRTDDECIPRMIVRATCEDDPTPAFDLYAHCCRVLDGRERSIR